jgi:hypothetical protein
LESNAAGVHGVTSLTKLSSYLIAKSQGADMIALPLFDAD